jgi:thioredoxin reductase
VTAPDVDVLVVGGGPAGLAAAIELRRFGVGRVLVVEREDEAGGTPRHASHPGFGLRDLHRILDGPAYALRYARLAARAGVEVCTGVTVTGWTGPTTLALTGAAGLTAVTARATVLATGCRERPRSARLVPGDRPLGVMTTGTLQQLVYLHHESPGRRAVVVGCEHVSFSAVLTLAHGRARTVAMVTEHPRHQTWAPFSWLAAGRLGVPILTHRRVTAIVGRRRVEAVEVTDARTGRVERLACDTVVFTGDWIPDHELARMGGVAMDPATRGPRVDPNGRTSQPGVFAAGNLVHAAEPADVAALGGRRAARAVRAYLESGQWPGRAPLPVECAAPVLWASPSALEPETRGTDLILRVSAFVDRATLLVRQDTRVLWRRRYRHLVPNRSVRAAVRWPGGLDPAAGAVTVALEE